MTSVNPPQNKTMISVAPNGGRLMKVDHPSIPLSAIELAKTAVCVSERGASMIHVHVRDNAGNHLLEPSAFKEVTKAIKQECGSDILVQITTEALGQYSAAEQTAVLKAVRPASASLALREFVSDQEAERDFSEVMGWIKEHEILPQIILYSPEEAVYLKELIQRGVVPFDDIPVLYVLGRYVAGQTSEPKDLLPFLASNQPDYSHWATCAFGKFEASCVLASALMGGHVRVGFENNRQLPNGELAQSNAALVTAVAEPLYCAGWDIATAEELIATWREILGIDVGRS